MNERNIVVVLQARRCQLRAWGRQLVTAGGGPSPGLCADGVRPQLGEDERREALQLALPVRQRRQGGCLPSLSPPPPWLLARRHFAVGKLLPLWQ